jgi:hypothetical protein
MRTLSAAFGRPHPSKRRLLSLLALAGPAWLAGCSGPARAPLPTPCTPPVAEVNWNGLHDEQASVRLKVLYDGLMASRANPDVTLAQLVQQDTQSRTEAMAMLKEGRLVTARDYFHAASIFVCGTCADHHVLALKLARRAWERGIGEAWGPYGQAAVRHIRDGGREPKYENGLFRSWLNLNPVNQEFWKVEQGVFRVPLKLPTTLESDRPALEEAVLAAQRSVMAFARRNGWEALCRESLLDRAGIFEDRSPYEKTLRQMRSVPAKEALKDVPPALLEERALIALSPALSGQTQDYAGLLAHALARGLYRRVLPEAPSEPSDVEAWLKTRGF